MFDAESGVVANFDVEGVEVLSFSYLGAGL